MRRTVIGVLVLAASIVGGVGGFVPTAGASSHHGEIRVQPRAYEGVDDTFTGALRLGCEPGLASAGVHLSFSQGGVTSPERRVATGPACNGRLQRQEYVSDMGFQPGRAVVHVRMVLVDAATGAPRGEVVASGSVYVRPAAKILLPETVEVRPGGVLKVRVQIRCDRPWLNFASFVSAQQFGGEAHASRVVEDVPCDGTYHPRTTWLKSTEARVFRAGWVRLQADVVLESADFEEGPGAFASRAARAL